MSVSSVFRHFRVLTITRDLRQCVHRHLDFVATLWGHVDMSHLNGSSVSGNFTQIDVCMLTCTAELVHFCMLAKCSCKRTCARVDACLCAVQFVMLSQPLATVLLVLIYFSLFPRLDPLWGVVKLSANHDQ